MECGGQRSRAKNSDTSPKRIKHQRARCGAPCSCLPASLSLIISSTIPFHPLFFFSPSLRGRYLYPSQPGRVSTQQVREKQGRRRRRSRRAAAFPDRLLLRADSGAGFSSHGSVSRVESLRCRRRIIFVCGLSPLTSISLHTFGSACD